MGKERNTAECDASETTAPSPLKGDLPRGALTMNEMEKRLREREPVSLSISLAEAVRFERDNR